MTVATTLSRWSHADGRRHTTRSASRTLTGVDITYGLHWLVTLRDHRMLRPGCEIRLVADSTWRGHRPGADQGRACLQIRVF